MLVLKISCNSETLRVLLEPNPDCACIRHAMQELWPNFSVRWMKYVDEEGDLCTLVEATFTDFMQTAREISCGRQVLKLQVELAPLELAPMQLTQEADYFDVGADELRRRAEVEENNRIEAEEKEEEKKRRREEKRKQKEEKEERRRKEREEKKAKEKLKEERAEEKRKRKQEEERKKEEWRLKKEQESQQKQQESTKLAEANDSNCTLCEDWEFVECYHITSVRSSDGVTVAKAEAKEVEDDTMKDIQDELHRIKAACEAELEMHLDEWLQTTNGQPSYEDWIAAVHPENIKERLASGYVIDSRMYLEGSFHRQLWNLRIAELASLNDDMKRLCQVLP